jgi:thioredoxin reductase
VKTTHHLANYPGFVDLVLGYEMVRNMHKQAERFGTKVELVTEGGASNGG